MNKADCIFCKIIAGVIPSTKIYENDKVLGFKDLSPHAAKHLLFIHKRHTTNVNQLTETDPQQLTDLFRAMREYTKDSKMDQEGFRIVTNEGSFGGQTVFHTHFHLLGGEPLGRFGK